MEAQPIPARASSVSLAQPDITLQLDMDGVIRGAGLANSVSSETVDSWFGRKWADTVEHGGSASVLAMVANARAHGASDFREVRQVFPSGLELPIEYNTVRLGGQAGLLAVGRNLQAVADARSRLIASQHAREQDTWKLRELETRNRLLFDSTDEPVLLLRAGDFQVTDANLAAVRAVGLDAGRDFTASVAALDRDAFRHMMAQVAGQGRAPGIVLRIGGAAAPWLVRAASASSEAGEIFQLRLYPAAHVSRPGAASTEALLDLMPDGFVLINAAGVVQRANRAFLDLVQMPAAAAAFGQSVGRWLSQPGTDAGVLIAAMRRHRVVRNFATTLHGELGTETAIEISGAAGDESGQIGLLLRDVSRRQSAACQPRAMSRLAELDDRIGTTTLTDLVSEASGMIERHCIETALLRSAGNRTAAAALLGMSRQSLYAKLNRYGIGTEETANPGGNQ